MIDANRPRGRVSAEKPAVSDQLLPADGAAGTFPPSGFSQIAAISTHMIESAIHEAPLSAGDRALDPGSAVSDGPVDSWPTATPNVIAGRENTLVDLARIGWLATVIACLIAVLILVTQGYFGYAAVTLAVAVSAAINLT